MKYFIDTHDRSKGSFPADEITEEEFKVKFAEFDLAALDEGVTAHVAHFNTADGKAYCLTRAENIEAVRCAHEKVNLPYDSITEVKSVRSSDA